MLPVWVFCCLPLNWDVMVYFYLLEKNIFNKKKACRYPTGFPSSQPFPLCGKKSIKILEGLGGNNTTNNTKKPKSSKPTPLPKTICRFNQNGILMFEMSVFFMPCLHCHLLMCHGPYKTGKRLHRVTYWFIPFLLLKWKYDFCAIIPKLPPRLALLFLWKISGCFSFTMSLFLFSQCIWKHPLSWTV